MTTEKFFAGKEMRFLVGVVHESAVFNQLSVASANTLTSGPEPGNINMAEK